jgi:hypothetical protein
MKRNKIKKILLLLGLICLVPVVIVGFYMSADLYHFFNPYLDRDIAGPMTISSAWTEIVPKEPLKPERQVQYIYLETTQPFDPDYSTWGIRYSDGSVVVPEVQLVDQDGNSYNLQPSSYSLKDPSRSDVVSGIGFDRQDLPKDKVYLMVRVRSGKAISSSRIYWRCCNQWDRK